MGRHTALTLSLPDPAEQDIRWFSGTGCVCYGPTVAEVFVGGTLIGTFGPKDVGVRNVLLVGLGSEPRIKKGKLAWAFAVCSEQLRRIRRLVESDGLEAIPARPRGGSKTKVSPSLRKRLFKLFEGGASAYEVHQRLAGKRNTSTLSYSTLCRVRQVWEAERGSDAVLISTEDATQPQAELPLVATVATGESKDQTAPRAEQVPEDEASRDEEVQGTSVRGGRFVQHVGGWLLLGAVHAMGLHGAVQSRWKEGKEWLERFRLVIDAVVLSLGLGQRCVEGVRRLATPSSAILLRADRMPSESWTRRVFKYYVGKASAFWVHLTMTRIYLERARAESQGAAVFYVDNHMRPYTGKHTVRKGWRMQDKRVRPGAMDYYVHDEDGRPVFRWDTPSHDSLTQWLSPVVRILRAGLGEDQRILVAFDRAGAYPEQMAALRDEGFEFVTYERRPYPLLAPSAFTEEVTVDDELIGVHESRLKNLGKGRGRVRRIALRMSDGHQVNLLAASKEPTGRIIEVMLGRWVQENGFKHGKERWGINQLDRRKVEPYSPQTIIPNPARRRLDNALKIARHTEGEARRQLARLAHDDQRRAKMEQVIVDSVAQQEQLAAQRPNVPHRARLEDTELKGKLAYHPGDYKTLIDTIRIACANAESELAATMAPHLLRPTEAKKALANLLAAPGEVRVNGKSITVTLSPAGTPNEHEAFQTLLLEVNRWKLTLPGDPDCRPLCFRSQLS